MQKKLQGKMRRRKTKNRKVTVAESLSGTVIVPDLPAESNMGPARGTKRKHTSLEGPSTGASLDKKETDAVTPPVHKKLCRLNAFNCQVEEDPDTGNHDYINRLSLEIMCRILDYLPLRDIMKVESLSQKLHKAVSLHLRVRTEISFTEHEIYSWMPKGFTDNSFSRFISRCPDLVYLYGVHPQNISKRRQRGQDTLSIPGVITALSSAKNVKGVETCDIFLLEALIIYLPKVEVICSFQNRHGCFPILPSNKLSLHHNPRITSLYLTGVVIPELPKMDFLKHLYLKWVRLTDQHPFRDFAVPMLETFVMNNCAGPTNALKYVPLITGLAAARSLARLELARVPFLGGLIQHVVEDSWRMQGFRHLQKIILAACKHALEVDLGYLAITCGQRLEELAIQPSLTKDSVFSSLTLAEVDFPSFETLHLGYVDPFPEPGKWTNEDLVHHGLADVSENPAMISDIGMKAVGQSFPNMKALNIYNCPHLHNPTNWFSPGLGWACLRDLHLRRCHAIRLQDFCRMIPMLQSLESLYLEQMFREPPKGCSRVGLSAGTGLGVSSALVSNTGNEPANNDQAQNNADGEAGNQNDENVADDEEADLEIAAANENAEVQGEVANQNEAQGVVANQNDAEGMAAIQDGGDDNNNGPEGAPAARNLESHNELGAGAGVEENQAEQNNNVPELARPHSDDELGEPQASSSGAQGAGTNQSGDRKDQIANRHAVYRGTTVAGVSTSSGIVASPSKSTSVSERELMQTDYCEADSGARPHSSPELMIQGDDCSVRDRVSSTNQPPCGTSANTSSASDHKCTCPAADGSVDKKCVVEGSSDASRVGSSPPRRTPSPRPGPSAEHGQGVTAKTGDVKTELGCSTMDPVEGESDTAKFGSDGYDQAEQETRKFMHEPSYAKSFDGEEICESMDVNEPDTSSGNRDSLVQSQEKSAESLSKSELHIGASDNASKSSSQRSSSYVDGDDLERGSSDVECFEDNDIDSDRQSCDSDVSPRHSEASTPVMVCTCRCQCAQHGGSASFDIAGDPVPSTSGMSTVTRVANTAAASSAEVRQGTDSVHVSFQAGTCGRVVGPGLSNTTQDQTAKGKGKSLTGLKKGIVKRSRHPSATVNQSCQAVSEEIRETTKKAKERDEAATKAKKDAARAEAMVQEAVGSAPAEQNPEEQQPGTSDQAAGSSLNQSKAAEASSSATSDGPEETGPAPVKTTATQTVRPQSTRSGQAPRKTTKRKPNTCDQATSTSDPVIEEDHVQVLSIRSATLVNLALHQVGITDLIIRDCPKLQMLTGSSCRVLKNVLITQAPRLVRVSFAQCRKLRHYDLVDEVCMQKGEKNRVIFLRPMQQYDPVDMESQLLRSSMYDYHMCLLHDYSPDPELTLYNKLRVASWLDIMSNINFELLQSMDFQEANRTKAMTNKYPWGRHTYRMQGESEGSHKWDLVTDLPWLRCLATSTPLSTAKPDAQDAKSGVYSPRAKGHIHTDYVLEVLGMDIAEARSCNRPLHTHAVVVYVNMCDRDGEPTPDKYV